MLTAAFLFLSSLLLRLVGRGRKGEGEGEGEGD